MQCTKSLLAKEHRSTDNAVMTDDDVSPLADEDEEMAIEKVIDRLAERFPSIEHAEVSKIVHEEAHKLDGGKVRDFVPVLVEHEARDRLRAQAEPVPLDVAAEEERLVPTGEPQHLDPMEIDRRSQQTGLFLGELDN